MSLVFCNLGESPECEGALNLAHVILQYRVGGECLGQMEAVVNLQGLADWALLGAGAHGAGRHPLGLPDVYGSVPHTARHSLLPQVQVD